ncbi:dehydrodolichyl diphosphate synthase 2 [Morus notabilis]|uniref:dehydrodolichyl diphosphate synthase 2 n=1 Tax=Morus notabilis TaxID=981085 RepID=UPI000CED0536|nr:dehydrodolichyl diphosphate synthase 2 [Morus notabilis]
MSLSLQLSLPSLMANPLFPRPNLIPLPPNSHARHLLLPPCPHAPVRVSVQREITEQEAEERGDIGNLKKPLGLQTPSPDGKQSDDSYLFSAGLRRESLPKHVAVIMDGNRRWARLRDLPVDSRYEAGLRSLRAVVEHCCKLGIEFLTVFAFSIDIWFRPKVEVEFLMSLFEQGVKNELGSFLQKIVFLFYVEFRILLLGLLARNNCNEMYLIDSLNRENIRVSIIGDTTKLPSSLQELIANVQESTKNNSRLQLVVAVSYSGQYDIVQACRKIAIKVTDGVLAPDDVTESLVEEELVTSCTKFPYPDLLLRTSGELRISNFFLWQLAYTELFFSPSLWPDFGKFDFLEALRTFQCRQRRYGVKSIE